MERRQETPPAAQRLPGEDRRVSDLRARAAEFRRRHVDPIAADLDRRLLLDPGHHPDEVVRRGCEFGLLSLPIPTSLGGQGGLSLDSAVTLEELSAGCAGVAYVFGSHHLAVLALLPSMDVPLLERVLGEIARAERRGEPLLCAAAVTEHGAGTDLAEPQPSPAARLPASARKVEGGYVLDGREALVSGGDVARWVLVRCPLDRSRSLETMTSFLVERGTRGFSTGRVERKMGQRACHAAELVFEECFVPDGSRIGAEGAASRLADVVLAASRAPAAAVATGIARGAYEIALAFARRRTCGAGLLGDRPWVRQVLADMRGSIDLSRRAYVGAATAFDERIGRPLLGDRTTPLAQAPVAECLGASSLAKASASDLAVQVCLHALEVVGRPGVEERERVEKLLRDAKLTQIQEGTSELALMAAYDGLVSGDGA